MMEVGKVQRQLDQKDLLKREEKVDPTVGKRFVLPRKKEDLTSHSGRTSWGGKKLVLAARKEEYRRVGPEKAAREALDVVEGGIF